MKVHKLLILLFFLFFTKFSTFNAPEVFPEVVVEDRFFELSIENYKRIFIIDADLDDKKANKLIDMKVNLVTLNPPTLGNCFEGIDGLIKPRVNISLRHWSLHSDASIRNTIYHEFTHCVCSFDHTPARSNLSDLLVFILHGEDRYYFPDKCPRSIMYPYAFDDSCSKKHWNDYLKDLKKICK